MPALANMNNSEQLLSSNYNIINHDNYDYHNNGLSSTKGLWSRHRDVVGCNQLQKVFDSSRATEQERELLYPDACGGGGQGWITQGTTAYGREHGMRETCVLHTARLSRETLVDFLSALVEETTCSQRRTLSFLILTGRMLPPSENTTCSQQPIGISFSVY